MACGCKNDKKTDNIANNSGDVITLTNVVHYILKFFGFLLSLCLLPIINLVIIWFIFRTLVLNRKVSVTPILTSILSKIKGKDKEEDEETENVEYEIANLEVIR